MIYESGVRYVGEKSKSPFGGVEVIPPDIIIESVLLKELYDSLTDLVYENESCTLV